MAQYDPLKEIVFDIDTVLSLDGNTASYLQYALVRIEAIARKARGDAGIEVEAIWKDVEALQFEGLEEEEKILVNALARFPGIIQRCLAEHSPHFLTDYAFDLAGLFNQFYHKCAVLKAPTPALVRSRLALTRAVNQVLSNAFALLGLEKLEVM
jgi:arginyl-tRNA synthetase